jgi:hypothetical protein
LVVDEEGKIEDTEYSVMLYALGMASLLELSALNLEFGSLNLKNGLNMQHFYLL